MANGTCVIHYPRTLTSCPCSTFPQGPVEFDVASNRWRRTLHPFRATTVDRWVAKAQRASAATRRNERQQPVFEEA